jgi:response regulator RpfG family c-di-GMP phosphodiesterase
MDEVDCEEEVTTLEVAQEVVESIHILTCTCESMKTTLDCQSKTVNTMLQQMNDHLQNLSEIQRSTQSILQQMTKIQSSTKSVSETMALQLKNQRLGWAIEHVKHVNNINYCTKTGLSGGSIQSLLIDILVDMSMDSQRN